MNATEEPIFDPANNDDGDDDDNMRTNDAAWCMHDYVAVYAAKRMMNQVGSRSFDPARLF